MDAWMDGADDELRDINPPQHDFGIRYHAENEIVQQATAGDLHAAAVVLQYLTSSIKDLRHIMQAVLHDNRDPKTWRCLLAYFAQQVWIDWQWLADEANTNQGKLAWTEPSHGAAMQAISQVFVEDENRIETLIKKSVLEKAFNAPYRVRYSAAYLMGMRNDIRAAPVLGEIIEDGRRVGIEWQMRAIDALEALNDTDCGAPLFKALVQGRGDLHKRASKALSELGARAQAVWVEALNHPDAHIRWHAARGLGQIGDPRGIEILAEGLYDENHAVRWTTAGVLAHLDTTAIPAILHIIMRHPMSETFRQVAHHALHAMGSHQAQEYVRPLVEALRSPITSVEAPTIARRLLQEWKPPR